MADSRLNFEDRVVVVTGAGRGLGRAYALAFARRGGKVVVNDSGAATDGRGQERGVADAVVQEIREAGGEAVASYDSVSDTAAAAQIITTALDAFGTVDVVVNNAGNAHMAPFAVSAMEEMRNIIDVHLMGGLAVTHAAWPIMVAKGYGRVVMTVSTAGLFGIENLVAYAAAKGGLFGLTKSLAREGAPLGILVNAISPGAQTRMAAGMFKPGKTAYTWRPELVAPPVLYLASEQCEHTGIVLSAMGGRYARAEMVEGKGVKLDPRQDLDVEEILAHLPEILDLTRAEALNHGFSTQIIGSASHKAED
jgi:NAD(P)-dependent dehydrogenase (short-subunit alcohol dehydrogenase family)